MLEWDLQWVRLDARMGPKSMHQGAETGYVLVSIIFFKVVYIFFLFMFNFGLCFCNKFWFVSTNEHLHSRATGKTVLDFY